MIMYTLLQSHSSPARRGCRGDLQPLFLGVLHTFVPAKYLFLLYLYSCAEARSLKPEVAVKQEQASKQAQAAGSKQGRLKSDVTGDRQPKVPDLR